MKLKFNWGTGIAATYILFVAGTLVMVAIFMNQDVSLETKDYYAKGLAYQEEIDKINRTKELSEQLDISLNESNIKFVFPSMFRSSKIDGSIFFYRPSSSKNDFTLPISIDSTSTFLIPTSKLAKGLWKIKVNWKVDGNEYLDNKIVMVN